MGALRVYSLKPGARGGRSRHDFCAGWRFHRGRAPGAERAGFDDSSWDEVALPHCVNAEDTFTPEKGYYRGPAWYRKHFAVDGVGGARRAHLVFEGSGTVTEVWVNGRSAARSVDGYTGMELDVTAAVADGDNVVAVCVDNTHDPDVLPGLEEPDYNVYGGIYREVYLTGTAEAYVPRAGLRVLTPGVSETSAQVVARVRVRSSRDCRVSLRATITDPDGDVVCESEVEAATEKGESAVEIKCPGIRNPLLWHPESPRLYRMEVQAECGGEVVDRVESRFGLRWFEFDSSAGFSINGRHLRLVGVNRHQDYPGLGHALPPRMQRADAEMIREMGANFVRLSHYPQHPAFLDACDELGICVYAEIASWQFIGGPKFHENAEEMLCAMVRRDANHPSVILWGLLNEGRDKALFERLHAAAREEDPSRPTVYAENNPEKGLALGTTGIPEVLGINYEIGRLDDVRAMFGGLRLLSSEHANATTHDPADPAHLSRQVDQIGAELDVLEARRWMAGSALWSMHDYGTDYDVSYPVQRSGALDEHRRPKESFHLLRARWRKDPVVHIEGHWNPVPDEPTRRVRVFTNCERVVLRLNGRDLGERTEGFIRTWEVPFEAGAIGAVGVKGGAEARHLVRTHGEPASLVLEAGAQELDGPGDACWLTATLFDVEGARVLATQHNVEFRALGTADICGVGGAPVARSVRGIARIALRAAAAGGEALVQARVGAIRSAVVRIGIGGRS